ncbi:allose kinase [Christensenella hongkongensis]|uniref:allose kinase n=1 Tax=Christensenella hongkongensis TaxID=270498 RepID=UPI0026728D8C|nr:allose kinase [Christensenella hongkongensis]
MEEERWIVGIDIGGTNFRIGCVSTSGRVANVKITPSSFLTRGECVQKTLAGYITKYRKETGVTPVCISVGIPGSVSKDRRSTISVPNLQDAKGTHLLDGLNLADDLEKLTGTRVILNKDVDNLLAFDILMNGLVDEEIVIGCYIGTGFGGAIRIMGRYLSGKNGAANEIGHIPFYKKDLICGCGKRGCAECYASGTALERIQEKYYPETFIGDIFVEHGTQQRLIEFVEACALPIATEINIFDPACVVIGGGVVDMPGFPKDMLKQFIWDNTRKPLPAGNLKLIFSNQDKDMGVIGAALLAAEGLKLDREKMTRGLLEHFGKH